MSRYSPSTPVQRPTHWAGSTGSTAVIISSPTFMGAGVSFAIASITLVSTVAFGIESVGSTVPQAPSAASSAIAVIVLAIIAFALSQSLASGFPIA
ncbi:hypothetical protein SPHINGOAX6_50277 [Sphingomonas sp. AX6]|nr:hypothetical protein SPHINGOAX6_50277 [Sphingomonas sp. AX6]